jgi:hypothetical protein
MSAPIATYWASREPGKDTYTLRIDLSDDPGETVIAGCSRERCEAEVKSRASMGYEIVSGLRRAFEAFAS